MGTKTKIFAGIGGILVLAAAYLSIRASQAPSQYSIPVAQEINKPCAGVFDLVADLSKWESWSPWKAHDPATKFIVDPTHIAGPGAKLSWTSKEMGNGSLTVLSFQQGTMLQYSLSFEGWDAKTLGQFDLLPISSARCRVTWTISGENGFMGKVFWVLFHFESAIRKDFADGLNRIAALP